MAGKRPYKPRENQCWGIDKICSINKILNKEKFILLVKWKHQQYKSGSDKR